MDDLLEKHLRHRMPTADRPLMGLTILVVEDSRIACEAIRLMSLRSGARIRRADCLRSAARHLRAYQPSVAIVDLGLPDGSGLNLIRDLTASSARVPAVIATSGETHWSETALKAGADAFLPKPVTSLAVFQETILGHLPVARRPDGPRPVSSESIPPDPIAMKDDLNHAARILGGRTDGKTLDYVAQFVGGVAISARDKALLKAARGLDEARHRHRTAEPALGHLNAMIRDRLSAAAVV